MAKKLEHTPNGMICRICGQDKDPYHFFNPRGKYNKKFFASGVPIGAVCWECGGDYKCITCGEIKPASEFRVQGRVCHSCKNTPRNSVSRIKTRANGGQRVNRRNVEKEPLWEGWA